MRCSLKLFVTHYEAFFRCSPLADSFNEFSITPAILKNDIKSLRLT